MKSGSQTSALTRALSGKVWAVVLGFFLVFAAWSFAAPYDGPPDEVQHAIRAAGVVSGQVAPPPVSVKWGINNDGAGAYQRVPEGLYTPARCWGFDPQKSAKCQPPISGGPLIDAPTSAGRYNPVYYAIVGGPLRLWPGWGGLVLSRLISAALSAILLGWAFSVLIRWSRFGLMLAALIAVSTPMLAHLAGAINPNGLEISAGIAFFAGAIPLFMGRRDGSANALAMNAPLLWLAGTGAALLAILRALGPVWLAFGLFALLVPQSRIFLRQLWANRLVRRWTYAVLASLAAALAWIFSAKGGELVGSPDRYHFGVGQASLIYFQNWEIFLKGMVGVAGWFDILMPKPLYWVWIGAAGSLIVFANVIGSWADRWRFFVLFVGGAVVPGVLQVAEANKTGFIIGGRYMLPLLVAMPLLAAFIIEERLLTAKQSHSMTKLFCVLLFPCHLALLVYAMMRWQQGAFEYPGLGRLNPLAGNWHPPTGSVVPPVVMIVGLILLAWTFWRAPALAASTAVPQPEPSQEERDDAGSDALKVTGTSDALDRRVATDRSAESEPSSRSAPNSVSI